MSQVFRDGLLHFYERWAKGVTGKETCIYGDLAFKLSVSFEDFLEKRNGSAVLISENQVVCSNSILLTLLKLEVMFWRWDYCAIPCPNMQQPTLVEFVCVVISFCLLSTFYKLATTSAGDSHSFSLQWWSCWPDTSSSIWGWFVHVWSIIHCQCLLWFDVSVIMSSVHGTWLSLLCSCFSINPFSAKGFPFDE